MLYIRTRRNVQVKSKISKLHILDRLDFLNDEKMEMKEDIRSGLLRECVMTLKGCYQLHTMKLGIIRMGNLEKD